jgi:hypothetical protein
MRIWRNNMVLPEWLISVLAFCALLLIAAVAILCVRASRSPHPGEQRAYDSLRVHAAHEPGTVSVVFHTYSGILVFVVQRKHHFWASPDDARMALWRLHKFNLTWGMFAYGALLIPLVSFLNYLAQKRSIERQTAAMSGGGTR